LIFGKKERTEKPKKEKTIKPKKEKVPKPKKEKPVKPKKEKPVIIKPEKDITYRTRGKGVWYFLRAVLWAVIAFFIFKGITVELRPDTSGEALKAIADFKAEFSGYKELDSEILSFAESFAVEYLTYTAGDEAGYNKRLAKYAAAAVTNATTVQFKSGTESRVEYVRAYRKETYSAAQYDVFVYAEVIRTHSVLIDEESKTYRLDDKTERITLKIPVYYANNRYIVEDLPAFVSDDVKAGEYPITAFGGIKVAEGVQTAVTAYLADFFKTWYEETQSKINVYLSPDADKSDFRGLEKTLVFGRIEDGALVYYPNETDKAPLIALVTVTASDGNGNEIKQNYTVTVIEKDGRYYVQKLDLRIKNINIGG